MHEKIANEVCSLVFKQSINNRYVRDAGDVCCIAPGGFKVRCTLLSQTMTQQNLHFKLEITMKDFR